MDEIEKRQEYIRKLYKTKLSCDKNLLELTTYNNIAMWWMVQPMVFNLLTIDACYPAKKAKLLTILYKIAGPFIQFFYDYSLLMIIKLMSCIYKRKHYPNQNSNKIAFLRQNFVWGYVMDSKTATRIIRDRYFYNVIKKFNSIYYDVLSFYPLAIRPICGIRAFIEQQKDTEIRHMPLEKYLNINVYREYIDSYRFFKKQWKILRHDLIFKNLCVYNGIDEYDKIMAHLEFYFIFLFPYLVRESELARSMLRCERPSAIVMINEYGWIERSYIVAAKTESVPVIALQHGVITPLHTGYNYKKDEIMGGTVNSPYCPIPDKIAVSGEYYFDLLTKISSYPQSNVVVTGQPRYDIMLRASEIYSKEKFCKIYNINPNHKIILWTTQCLAFSDEENNKNLDCVLSSMEDVFDATLIVKQHPEEPNIYTKKIKEYIKKYKSKKVLLVAKNSDIYELVCICDLLITKMSTTAMEAAALNKPVIALDLSGDQDTARYVSEGIAIGVYKSDDLTTAIKNLLENDSLLAKRRESYVLEHLYKIDGKASERVVDLIIKAIS